MLSGIFGMLGVLAGTFGAHGLRGYLSDEMLQVYRTGVQYHLIHTLAILGTALASARLRSRTVTMAGWCFTWGIVLFSGSLYIMTITGLKWLGMITPIGGLALIAGWMMLFVGAWQWNPANGNGHTNGSPPNA